MSRLLSTGDLLALESRPNSKASAVSDARSRNVFEANRTLAMRLTDQAVGLAAQTLALRACRAPRPKLAECLAFLRNGDVLTVTKPGRLVRSTAELLAIEADLSRRGIGLVILWPSNSNCRASGYRSSGVIMLRYGHGFSSRWPCKVSASVTDVSARPAADARWWSGCGCPAARRPHGQELRGERLR